MITQVYLGGYYKDELISMQNWVEQQLLSTKILSYWCVHLFQSDSVELSESSKQMYRWDFGTQSYWRYKYKTTGIK